MRLPSHQREELRRRRQAVLRRRRVTALGGLAALVVALVEVVGGGGPRTSHLSGAGPVGAATVPVLPEAHILTGPPRIITVPGKAPRLAWPATGQAAAGVSGLGVMAASPRERPWPIASMTKMMTALVVERDHPLPSGGAGPLVTMTASDVATYLYDSSHDDSNVPVRRGERLSELQLLEGLLIPSSDNLARTLAVWDAGSLRGFVAEMNATARALGLRNTHYGDPAGLSAGSRSTAADQVIVAEALMAVPVLREVVAQSHVAFPVAGTIWNYNPALGVDGIVGVKSGFTQLAQGCLAVAAPRTVAGRAVYVVAVSMRQPDGLAGAAQADEQLLVTAEAALRPYRVLAAGAEVARVVVPWSRRFLGALAPDGLVVPSWGGLRLEELVLAGPSLHAGVPAGADAGELTVRAAGSPGEAGPGTATGTPAAPAAAAVLRLSGPVVGPGAGARGGSAS